jgi:hypothetical protein
MSIFKKRHFANVDAEKVNDDGDAFYDTIVSSHRRRVDDSATFAIDNASNNNIESSETVSNVDYFGVSQHVSSSSSSDNNTTATDVSTASGGERVSGFVSRLKRKFVAASDETNAESLESSRNVPTANVPTAPAYVRSRVKRKQQQQHENDDDDDSFGNSVQKRIRVLQHAKLFERVIRGVVSRLEDMFFCHTVAMPETPQEFLCFLQQNQSLTVGEHECGTIQALHTLLQMGVLALDDFGNVSCDRPMLANQAAMLQLHRCELLPPPSERAYDDMSGEMFVDIVASIVEQLRISAPFCVPLDQMLHQLTSLCRISSSYSPADIYQTLLNHGVLQLDESGERLQYALVPRTVAPEQQLLHHSHGVEAY